MRIEPYSAAGHFQLSRRWVPQASQTSGNLWTFRNPSASVLAVILRVRLRALQVGNPTAAIEDRFSLKVARSFTAAYSTGSASIAPAAGMQKVRASLANSAMELRESTAAGGATGGTATPDTDPFANGSIWVVATAPTAASHVPIDVFDYRPDPGIYPIVLAQNEGLIITNDNNFGAAAGIVLYLGILWDETTIF